MFHSKGVDEMNMRFARIFAFVAFMSAGQAFSETVTKEGDYVTSSGQLVHCVSGSSGRVYCGSAKTRYVIAGAPDPRCVEGRTWGLDDQGVWVANGCVADFTPVNSSYVDSNGQLVHCVSTDSGRTYCGTANTRYSIYGNPDPR